MIIVLLIDTSTCTAQTFPNGETLLDAARHTAKSLVQRVKQRIPTTRFLLVSYASGMKAIKCSLLDPVEKLMYALGQLQANDIWHGGGALGAVFDALQLDRTLRQMDNFGQGRSPGIFEPVKILWFAYGGSNQQCEQRLEIPGSVCPGSDLYREPFRWDHRVYALLMLPENDTPAAEQIGMMATVTGGEVYWARSKSELEACVEKIIPSEMDEQALLSMPESGVMITFDDIGQHPNHTGTHHQSMHSAFVLPVPSRHFYRLPIPEAFFPTPEMSKLPPRSAHPVLQMVWQPTPWTAPEVLPHDNYTLYSKAMLVHMRSYPADGHWRVHVANSLRKQDLGLPFAVVRLVKHESGHEEIRMSILPYNYPGLLSVFGNIVQDASGQFTEASRHLVQQYLSQIPSYYLSVLHEAFEKIGLTNLTVAPAEGSVLPPRIMQLLSRMHDAATAFQLAQTKARLQTNPIEIAADDVNNQLAALHIWLFEGVPGFSKIQIRWPKEDETFQHLPIRHPCIEYGDHVVLRPEPVRPPVPRPIEVADTEQVDPTAVLAALRSALASAGLTDAPDVQKESIDAMEVDASNVSAGQTRRSSATATPKVTTRRSSTAANELIDIVESMVPSKRSMTHEPEPILDESATSDHSTPIARTPTPKVPRLDKTGSSSQATDHTVTAGGKSTDASASSSSSSAAAAAIKATPPTSTQDMASGQAKAKPTVAKPAKTTLEPITDVKNRLVKNIKQGRKVYNEEEVVSTLEACCAASGYTKEQKRSLISACLLAAKTMRRHTLIETLERLKSQFK